MPLQAKRLVDDIRRERLGHLWGTDDVSEAAR